MQNLIQIVNNEARVSAIEIAENTDNNYASVRNRILQYKEYLEKMGEIPTAFLKKATDKLGRKNKSKEVAMLNERQAFFLMALLKNSNKIVEFKFALTNQFIDMRDSLYPKNTNFYKLNGRIGGLTYANNKYLKEIKSLEEQRDSLNLQIVELKKMNPYQITEVTPPRLGYESDSFMNDPCLHNDFLEFLYQANKAVHEVNIIRHLSSGLDSTHQSMSNFMLHMTRRYEKIRGVSKYHQQ